MYLKLNKVLLLYDIFFANTFISFPFVFKLYEKSALMSCSVIFWKFLYFIFLEFILILIDSNLSLMFLLLKRFVFISLFKFIFPMIVSMFEYKIDLLLFPFIEIFILLIYSFFIK